MNRSITLGIVFLLITAATANAAPVLIVAGKVTDAAGQPVKGTISVVNETRNLEQTTEIKPSGEYMVIFVAVANEQNSVAEAGDVIRISAFNANGESVASRTYQLKAADITAAHLVANMTIQEPIPPIPVLVVSGVVRDVQGKPVSAGVSVQVKNEDRRLTATSTTNAAGQYVVTFLTMDGEGVVAQVGDTISATAQNTMKKHKLTTEDIRAAHVSIDIQPPEKLHFVKVSGKVASPKTRLPFEVGEGNELHLTLVASGGTGDQFTYTALPLPDGASIEGDTFVWFPGYDTVTRGEGQKDFNMTLSVTYGKEKADQPIRINVHNASNAETLTVSVSAKKLAGLPGSTANVRVMVKDAQGKPVTDELVTLKLTPQVGSLSELKNQGKGIYTATYTAGTELGEVKITASTTNGKQGSDSLTLIEGPPAELQLTIEPSELIAGSGKTAIVTVKVYDAAKHPLKDEQVSLSLSLQVGKLSPIKEQGDGAYTATYTVGETSGAVTLTATVEKITQEKTITLKELGEPSPSHSLVEVNSPLEAGHTATITVTLRDINDNPVFNRKAHISIEGVDEPIETALTNAQGQAQVTTKNFLKTGSYPITVRVLDNPTFEKESLIEVKPALPHNIKIVAPGKAEAKTQVILTVSVSDKYGNPVSDANVEMKTDLGTVTSPAEAKGDGKYTATFHADKAGTAKITASIENAPSVTVQVQVYEIPEKSRLLQNYPNPFNPETWIPYQLAKPADVTIHIYDARGQLIRTISLGQKETGFYIAPAKAAHWNGRNALGERVASGLYFYQITAGDFTATRRMAIMNFSPDNQKSW